MRVAIIGNSSSGKSTLARQLSEMYAVDVLDLDTVAWEPGKIAVRRPAEDVLADVKAFCAANDSWVVEGCYASLIEGTFYHKPELWLLDPGRDQCIANCCSRPWEPHKYATKQDQEEKLSFLLEWVADYYSRDDDLSLRRYRELYAGYTGTKRWIRDLAVDLSDWR